MTYHQFVQTVAAEMKEVVNEDIALNVYEAEKNNGVKRLGITFSQQGVNLSPTIYLEEYYEKYLRGWRMDLVVEDILHLYYEVRMEKSWDEEIVSEFCRIEDKIIYRLINFEANKELLKDVPFVPYLDLAIVFYVMLEVNEKGMAGMLIRKEHLDMWNTPEKVLLEKAKENTWKLFPTEFHVMRAIIKEYNGVVEFPGLDIMHVLTNHVRSFGASVILYEGCLEMIGEFLGDNFYVLPSSVHEVIIVSEREAPCGRQGLSEMVEEINRTQVEIEDVLSDIAYYYDRDEKKLM